MKELQPQYETLAEGRAVFVHIRFCRARGANTFGCASLLKSVAGRHASTVVSESYPLVDSCEVLGVKWFERLCLSSSRKT